MSGAPVVPGLRQRARAAVAPVPWRDLLASWLVARVVVLSALLTAQFLRQELMVRHGYRLPHYSLLGWDASWYDRIAQHGYALEPQQALRFFPLVPLLARALGILLLGHDGIALLLLANGGALVLGALLHRLALSEGLGEAAARRAVWALAFAPAAFVLVMGYSEAVYGVLVVGCLLALRRQQWAVAAVLAALTGASRPTGVLLAVPALVEGVRGLRSAGARQWLLRGAAVAAPAAGLLAYLGWVQVRFGDYRLPFSVQEKAGLRGGLIANTPHEIVRSLSRLPTRLDATLVHLPWLVLSLVLFVVVVRRLPRSLAAYTAAGLLLASTGHLLGSFERYAAATPPLLLAAGLVTGGATRSRVVLAGAAGLLSAYAFLAFIVLYTP